MNEAQVKACRGVIVLISLLPGSLLFVVGLIILHLWTAHLAWQHLGLFWGITALCLPILSEVVMIVASLIYGPWTYPLAALSILIGVCFFGWLAYVAESGGLPSTLLVALVYVIACTVSFVWLALNYCQTAGIF